MWTILFILKNLLNLLKKVSNKFVVVHLPSLVSVIIKLEQTKDCLIFVYGHELICPTEKYIPIHENSMGGSF